MAYKSVVQAAGTALLVLCGAATAAAAFDISEPDVEKGKQQLEAIHVGQSGFAGGTGGNTRNLQTLGYLYGLTDFWQIKAGVFADRLDDRDWKVSAVLFENTFELLKWRKTGGFGLAWFTAASGATSDDATNAVTFGPILKFASEKFALTLNPFLDKTFGQNHAEGIAFAYGWQLGAQVAEGVTLALAGFGRVENLGDAPVLREQEHKIGPVLAFEHGLDDKRTLSLELGVFLGLTAATPDQAVKVKLTYGF
ncbi:MAG: hypothetical protein ACM31O_06315 [Bacteroidota bacterium]